MTDEALAEAAVAANRVELAAREIAQGGGPEADEAERAHRQAAALRKAMEYWIVRRATRARLAQR